MSPMWLCPYCDEKTALISRLKDQRNHAYAVIEEMKGERNEARRLARYFYDNWKMACERAEIFLAAKESLAAELLSQDELLRQNESLAASNIILLRDVENLKSDLDEAGREIVRLKSQGTFVAFNSWGNERVAQLEAANARLKKAALRLYHGGSAPNWFDKFLVSLHKYAQKNAAASAWKRAAKWWRNWAKFRDQDALYDLRLDSQDRRLQRRTDRMIERQHASIEVDEIPY